MNTKQLIRIFSVVFLLYTLHITHYTSLAFCASKGNPPVAHWRFDDAGGPTAYDESTNNNDGTLAPGTLGTNTAAGQMWRPQGKIGAALEFDGTDDYVSASGVTFSGNQMTVSGWFYAIAEPGSGAGVTQATGTDSPATTAFLLHPGAGTGNWSATFYISN